MVNGIYNTDRDKLRLRKISYWVSFMLGRKLNLFLFWIQVFYNICKSVLIFEFIWQLDKWRFPRIYSASLLLDPEYYLDSNLRVRNLCFPFPCYLWPPETTKLYRVSQLLSFFNFCKSEKFKTLPILMFWMSLRKLPNKRGSILSGLPVCY